MRTENVLSKIFASSNFYRIEWKCIMWRKTKIYLGIHLIDRKMSNPYHVGIPILILALWILFSALDDTSCCNIHITHIPQNIYVH